MKDAMWNLQSQFLKMYITSYTKYIILQSSFYTTGRRNYALPQKSFLFWARSSIWDARELDAAERAEIWDNLSSVGKARKEKVNRKIKRTYSNSADIFLIFFMPSFTVDAKTVPQCTSIQLLGNRHAGEEPHKEASS